MFGKKHSVVTVEDLLRDLEDHNGDADVIRILKQFIDNNLMATTGIILIWVEGKNAYIEGSRISEQEAIWALEKAKVETLNKRGFAHD